MIWHRVWHFGLPIRFDVSIVLETSFIIKISYCPLWCPNLSKFATITLPETNIAPKNGWLEYYFPFGFRPIFRCKRLVLGRVFISPFA